MTDGRQAAELSARAALDIILMDRQMPELDGVEATRQIHAREAREEIRRCQALINRALADRDQLAAAPRTPSPADGQGAG